MTGPRTFSRSYLLVAASQGLSSATNLLPFAAAILFSTTAEVGIAATGFSFILFFQGLGRSISGQVLTVIEPERASKAAWESIRGAAVTAGVGSAVAITTWAVFGWELGALAAVALPFVVAIDLARYVCFATKNPAQATAIDAMWFSLTLLGLAIFYEDLTARWMLTVWIGAAMPTALLSVRHAWSNLRDLAVKPTEQVVPNRTKFVFALEFVAGAGMAQLAILALGLIVTSEVLGQYRIGLLAFAPLMIASVVLQTTWGPQLASNFLSEDPDLVRTQRSAARSQQIYLSLAWCICVGITSTVLSGRSEELLGTWWPAILGGIGLAFLIANASAVDSVLLKVAMAERDLLATRLATGAIQLALVALGSRAGAAGIAAGLALSTIVNAPRWFFAAERSMPRT